MFGYETLFPREGLASQTMAYVLVRLTQMRCRLVVAFGFVVPLTLMQLVIWFQWRRRSYGRRWRSGPAGVLPSLSLIQLVSSLETSRSRVGFWARGCPADLSPGDMEKRKVVDEGTMKRTIFRGGELGGQGVLKPPQI